MSDWEYVAAFLAAFAIRGSPAPNHVKRFFSVFTKKEGEEEKRPNLPRQNYGDYYSGREKEE